MLITLLLMADSAFAFSTQVYNWNFKPKENNEPPTTEPHYEQLLEKYGGFYIGDTSKKDIYLTFDNGYENGYTQKVLDVLKEKQVPAAFFVTGHYMDTERELIKRMVEEGHIVGNHSYHHPSLPEVDDARLKRELENLKNLYTEVTGDSQMQYLRPPRGTFSEKSLALSQQFGYTNVFWSFAYVDWEVNRQKGWQHAYDSIMRRIHPGAVMLLHSVSSDNAEALPKVIDDLRAKGYEFKSLDHLAVANKVTPFRREEERYGKNE
ncbi:delta-lactam-biosynthetic de-N-acetylase [Alteribacter lacisalsi]|uniref:Delta-lactam-biosynthetic de-N-acetylase n=1 Tax=Alteribacter lacisalsi TaxID=2045244 RepID=A0A2W0HTU4_9BACI|nr:delta-lactam-biosynthetic de-N-acetylase [Alteribacter lacisalsi]PYZ97038.1 delta-lactam-biosynthetic de-N-acetylase [Alteribacter lacisalsi]